MAPSRQRPSYLVGERLFCAECVIEMGCMVALDPRAFLNNFSQVARCSQFSSQQIQFVYTVVNYARHSTTFRQYIFYAHRVKIDLFSGVKKMKDLDKGY